MTGGRPAEVGGGLAVAVVTKHGIGKCGLQWCPLSVLAEDDGKENDGKEKIHLMSV